MSREERFFDNAVIEISVGYLKEKISRHVGYLSIYALAMALREYIHWYTVELYGATVRNLWGDLRKLLQPEVE